MSDTIILNGIAVELTSDLGRAFVSDACRAGESVIDDSTLMEKYDLTPEDLQKLANNKAIGRLILREREHRLRSGIATKELAARSYFKVPPVLESVLLSEQAPARARIESARELRAISTPENQSNPTQNSERFHIVINLGTDVLTFDKPIAVGVDDTPPDEQPKLTAAKQPKLVVLSNDGVSDNE